MKMIPIEIDEQVHSELERRVKGFNQSENSVLRIILGLEKQPAVEPPKSLTTCNGELDAFLQSQEYRFTATADERYLRLLSWLLNHHKELQSKIDNYRSRKRVYFAIDPKRIEASSLNVTTKRIPDSRVFAMVTLSNSSKRKIVAHVLRLAGYGGDLVHRTLETFPDSGIHRGRNSFGNIRV